MPQTLTIRPAGRADIPGIDALLARSYPALLKADYAPSVLVTALPLIARANPQLVVSGSYFVAVDGTTRIVGAGGWSFRAPQGGRADGATAHIRHVATCPDMLRRGIGRALMAEVVTTSTAAGAVRLDCQSTITAVPFYAALGFRPLAEILVTLRPGITFPAVQMHRPLT